MTINQLITALINYSLDKNLITELDKTYTVNRIIEILNLNEYTYESCDETDLSVILDGICDYAIEQGIVEDSITYRDLFDTKIMGAVMPRPSEVINKFNALYEKSPEEATKYYYDLSRNSNYIRVDRIKKDKKWTTETEFGTLDITINLSKPEKDPKAIAAAKNAK